MTKNATKKKLLAQLVTDCIAIYDSRGAKTDAASALCNVLVALQALRPGLVQPRVAYFRRRRWEDFSRKWARSEWRKASSTLVLTYTARNDLTSYKTPTERTSWMRCRIGACPEGC